MPLIFLEPYDGGSHKYFINQMESLLSQSFPNLKIIRLGLSPRHWRLRLQTSHLQLAELCLREISLEEVPIFFANSLMDVAAFRSLLPPQWRNASIVTYFHENQMSYPLKKNQSIENERNHQRHIYPAFHLNQILASDLCLFNSNFCLRDTFSKIEDFLNTRAEFFSQSALKKKEIDSKVIGIPLDVPKKREFPGFFQRPKRILWNHRWEHDKNPNEFLKICEGLLKENHEYGINLLGENREKENPIIERFLNLFSPQIPHHGHLAKREDYWAKVSECRLLLVTSFHDFFGISVREAICAGVIPLLPNRMVYPELIPKSLHEKLLYPENIGRGELQRRAIALIEEGLSESESQELLSCANDPILHKDWIEIFSAII